MRRRRCHCATGTFQSGGQPQPVRCRPLVPLLTPAALAGFPSVFGAIWRDRTSAELSPRPRFSKPSHCRSGKIACRQRRLPPASALSPYTKNRRRRDEALQRFRRSLDLCRRSPPETMKESPPLPGWHRELWALSSLPALRPRRWSIKWESNPRTRLGRPLHLPLCY